MSRDPELQRFLDRYLLIFLAAYFLSLFAMAGTFSMVWSSYCRECTREIAYPASLAVLILALSTAHAAVVRGFYWGAWWVAGLCIGSIAFLIPTYAYGPHKMVFTSILIAALLGLLVLNSRTYRQMRIVLAEYRAKRRQERAGRDSKGRTPKP
ncbi:hypothetical protein ACE1YR_19010 [Pseudomonas sp. K1(2024)]|uniref:Uncharacterized protein n=1 Tax=Pseudomonas boreofloridensis TaxID=3064348 RepID=A0ABV4ZDW5_9PSED|nr:hypothetical protein [Pseudomonas sp. K13]MDO7901458.1 hypothetical protein [Pseudomonas sp. K13]